MRLVATLAVVTALGAGAPAVAATVIAAEHVTVSLVARDARIAPATTTSLGLHFALEDGWHVYWKNPGDSGEPPSVAWNLPRGFRAGAIEWPAPERIRVGPLANYGYEGSVLLPIDLDVPADLTIGTSATVAADVSWLVCRAEECVPGTAVLARALPIAAHAVPDPPTRAAIEAARARVPGAARRAIVEVADPTTLRVRVAGLVPPAGATVELFVGTPGVVETAAPQRVRVERSGLEIEVQRSPARPGAVEALDGVVAVGEGPNARLYRIAAEAPAGSLWLALGLALAGGFLLNLMPCVFPVLSLKVLSFVRQSDEAPGRVRAHGWAFTLGVLISFWVLAGALLALRAGGEQLGWGFQLQSPAMVAALAILMTVLGASLAGLFDIGLALTTTGGRIQHATGLGGSFGTGALATVVATPCTAPFMGAALGWALTQPPIAAMLVFTALGTGMALPYLVLAHVPSALRLLPRPGPWMETVKTLLAFPLFATALWLVWVFHLQMGADAAFLLLASLLALTLAARLWGETRTRSRAVGWRVGTTLALVGATALAVAALVGAPPDHRTARAPDPFWAPWTPEREATLRAAGTPVFVNYTAAWCLTCQVNERLVFAATDVREAFRRAGIATLEADWTDRNAAIAAALDRHGRSGVPLYVLYGGDPAAPAHILSQLPTRAEVIRTITAAVDPHPKEERS